MTRIAMSPITGTIYAGRMNKAANAWSGTKTDVTSDFLRAVVEKAEFHGGSFPIRGSDGSVRMVTVTALEEQKS